MIHAEIRDLLGAGGDLTYLADAAAKSERFAATTALLQEAVEIDRLVQDQQGLGVDLARQGRALINLDFAPAAVAAWVQARDSYRAIGDPAAEAVDANLQKLRETLGSEKYDEIIAQAADRGDEIRLGAVEEARKMCAEDALVKRVLELLATLRPPREP